MSRFAVLVWSATVLACGYHPTYPLRSRVVVASVTTHAPVPDVAACLTEELRLGLEAASPRADEAAYRLEGEVIDASIEPGTLARAVDGLRPVDQDTSLVFRARLLRVGHGVVWGPQVYRIRRRAIEGARASESSSAASVQITWSCAELAERVIDDVTDVVASQGDP